MEVNCPNCGKPVAWAPESSFRPFCSERCRLIDLGAWFNEEHAIPSDDSDSPDHHDPDAHPQRPPS